MTTATVLACAVLLVFASGAACLLLGRLDNRLGEHMLLDPRTALRERIQHWLGIDHLHQHLRRQENLMATITEALTALAGQVNAVSAAQATSFHNLQVAIATLKSGELSPDQQAAVDQIEQSLTTLADDAQKADDGFEPDAPPTDAGDTPVVNAKR